jgi:hypothetical protein
VSAPHSSSTIFCFGVAAGRMAALGVTIRSAFAQIRSRHRRIGSTISARSTRRLFDPG